MATSESTLSTSEQQVRLMIWYVPRSTSTVLFKCLSFVEDSKGFLDMFGNVYTAVIPEAQRREMHDVSEMEQRFMAFLKDASMVTGISGGIDASQSTRQWVKEQLEEAHLGKRFIFAKEVAYKITGHLEFIPRGYRHLFLIRHPLKVFPSTKKNFLRMAKDMSPEEFNMNEMPPIWFPKGFGFGETLELLEHVKKEIDPEAIVIDSDDLLQDPKGILSAVFKNIGLPFNEKILNWEAGDAVTKKWVVARLYLQANKLVGLYKNALDSTCFQKPNPLPDRSSVSPDLLSFVDASMLYYEKMYSQRLLAL